MRQSAAAPAGWSGLLGGIARECGTVGTTRRQLQEQLAPVSLETAMPQVPPAPRCAQCGHRYRKRRARSPQAAMKVTCSCHTRSNWRLLTMPCE